MTDTTQFVLLYISTKFSEPAAFKAIIGTRLVLKVNVCAVHNNRAQQTAAAAAA